MNRISHVFSNIDSSALVVNFEDKDKNNLESCSSNYKS